MKKFIFILLFIFCCVFLYLKNSLSLLNKTSNLNINLISTVSNSNNLYNNKIAPGSYGYFSILIKSNKNINFKVITANSKIPSNLIVYINNSPVDIYENNSCLYTENTNSVDKLTFYWELPFDNSYLNFTNSNTSFNENNINAINNASSLDKFNLCMNLQILFERN